MSGGPYRKPVPLKVERVLELFDKGMTRVEVAEKMGRRESAHLYQLWLNERGCPTPRMQRTAELER